MNNNTILIERYLQNEMTAVERTAFEQQLATDKNLQEEMRIQQQLHQAAMNAGIKTEFGKAISRKIWKGKLIKWGLIVGVAAAAIALYTFKDSIFPHAKSGEGVIERSKNSEFFSVNAAADTIIETKDGVVFAIPAHAFNTASNTVQLEIKTALNAYDIIQNGLSTISNGNLLQTGGMFYINGIADGKAVSLAKDISVSVPAAGELNPNMQLFDGVEDSNGVINWVNPKPIDNGLRTYDITSLDFYPPRYIPTLKGLGKDYKNKQYTDSLYYSFSGYPHGRRFVMNEYNENIPVERSIKENGAMYANYKEDGDQQNQQDQQATDSADMTSHESPYQIDPAKIGAIWDRKFNNTILATKEFEERLRYMHTLCTDEFLRVYFENLNKPLYYSDSICVAAFRNMESMNGAMKTKFMEFYKRRDGGVMIASGMQQELSAYFEKKYTAYKEAAAKTWANYQHALDSLQNIANVKRYQQSVKDFIRENQNFTEELQINLANAYRQLGINYNDTPRIPAANYYNVTISTTGWKNLDFYVTVATENRESMAYKDPGTGKTATLTYNEVNIKIDNVKQYDRVLVYLIPDSLSSFERIPQNGDSFKRPLNSLFKYDGIVLAYKGTQAYFVKQEDLQPKEYVLNLSPVSDEALRAALSNYTVNKQNDFNTEFAYRLFEQKEVERNVKLQQDIAFREKIAASIFNCFDAEQAILNSGDSEISADAGDFLDSVGTGTVPIPQK
ncbi:hypothetical protein [Ferruginibacter sp.]